MRFLTFITILSTLPPLATQSHAQSVMPNNYYDLSVVRGDNYEDGDFNIRLTSPTSVSGCVKIEPPRIETIDAGPVLYMTLKEGAVRAQEERRFTQSGGCTMNSGPSFVDIPLNKNTIEENGIKRIDLKSNAAGKLFDIALSTSENKVRIDSQLKAPVTDDRIEKHKIIDHWFYPKNTLVIFTPDMEKSSEKQEQLKEFAMGLGMMPLGSIIPDYTPAQMDVKQLFFVDVKDNLGEDLGPKNTITIGTIKDFETYQGPTGEYQKATNQTVFARRVGKYD